MNTSHSLSEVRFTRFPASGFALLAFASLAIFAFVGALFASPGSAEASTNLISNPTFSASQNGLPTDWAKGRWGTNTTTFTYPVAGSDDAFAASLSITSYASGDAKWYFKDVPVTGGGNYHFADMYQSNTQSYLTARYTRADGSAVYIDLATLPAASSWQAASVDFTAPADAQSLTIFHLINSVGTLTVDAYDLEQAAVVVTPPGDPDNLVPNFSFETGGSNGLPQGWLKGRWGTNTTVFTYPVTGFSTPRAARVAISNYASGDAKWYFGTVPVTGGATYSFSDNYKSTTGSVVTVGWIMGDGSTRWHDMTFLASTGGAWQVASASAAAPAGAVSAMLFHLIRSNGSLDIDDVVFKKVGAPSLQGGLVSITFDDGTQGIYDFAIPILDKAGLKSTQFIVTGRFNDTGFVSQDEVLSMFRDGQEIGAHTRSHVYLTTLSSADAWNEINGSRSDLINLGITPALFAYPFGDYDTTIQAMVRDAGFLGARATNNGFNVKGDIDPYALKRQNVDALVSFATVKGWIDSAMANKTWLILTFHAVNDSGQAYTLSASRFQQIVDYLKSVNAPVVTAGEGLRIMQQ